MVDCVWTASRKYLEWIGRASRPLRASLLIMAVGAVGTSLTTERTLLIRRHVTAHPCRVNTLHVNDCTLSLTHKHTQIAQLRPLFVSFIYVKIISYFRIQRFNYFTELGHDHNRCNPCSLHTVWDICLAYVTLIWGLVLSPHYTIIPFMWLMHQKFKQQLLLLFFFTCRMLLLKKKMSWLLNVCQSFAHTQLLIGVQLNESSAYRCLCTWDSQFVLPELQVHHNKCGKRSKL